MRKLFRTSLAAIVSVAISMTFFSCGPDEPDNNGGGGNGGNGGGGGSSTVAVTGVSISKSSLSLVEGGSETLTATVTPDNATNKAVSWKSSDAATATVDNSGKVTAVKAGSATITVTTTDGSKTATCSVTVTAKTVAVSGVTLDHANLEITTGETAQLKATVSPDNASDKSVEWTSSDASVATVDGTGKVTAVKAGTATITVKTKDGGKTATCSVTVNPIAVESVTVEPAKAEIVEGNTVQLKATVSPASANQEVEWSTSDSGIATVDANGLVTAKKPGTVYISVRSKTFTDKITSCEVIVKPDDSLKGISFDASEIQLEAGQSRTLTVIYTPEYAANKNVNWSSSDPSVASVKDGNVTGVKEGTATITATSEEGGHKAECVVTVSKASGPKVYTTDEDYKILINGAPDPLDGAFDNGETFRFINVDYIAAEGSTLYSLESYFNNYNSSTSHHICKDRKPIIDVSKYTDGRDNNNKTLTDFTARNGYFAILMKTDGNSALTVVRTKEGQKYFDIFDIPGKGNEFYEPHLALAPNGDIHISVRVKDSFHKDHMTWIKIAGAGALTQSYLDDYNSGPIDVTEAGDVYNLSYRETEEGQVGRLYKNGKLEKTIDGSEYNFSCLLKCVGNDVYTAVLDYTANTINIRKNGNSYQTITMANKSILPARRSFWVTSGGDVYICVAPHADYKNTVLYKNGKVLYKSNGLKQVCVIEE